MATEIKLVINPAKITEIANNRNADSMLNAQSEVSEPMSLVGLSIDVLPIDLSEFTQVRHIKVKPNTTIPQHAHEGPVFRYIMKGSAVVNGETYKEGDWMIIPSGKEYLIETNAGYEALWICVICSLK